ncbi:MAG: 4'-phosphopantetheinyl transferase superfamily protein [Beijerinckiaceae bacterium]|nr:4'-phosphopantetheinyl transferase superfamily protein [Beijerinckiaceae bacterium]
MATDDIRFNDIENCDELVLAADEAHVWRFPLDRSPIAIPALAATLDLQDQERAARLKDPAARRAFVIAHGVMRYILSIYTKVAPRTLRFGAGEFGKPFLMLDGAPQFNLAHTRARAVLAVTQKAAIGADIETLRDMPDLLRLARDHFSRTEYVHLVSLPQDARMQAFHACWTRKEAYIKALGGGVSIDLKSFDVSLEPGAPAALLSVDGHDAAAREWTLRTFRFGADHVGAVAIAQPGMRMRGLNFPPL